MNQVDKELLQKRGFLNKKEQVVPEKIKQGALLDAIEFAQTLLTNSYHRDLKQISEKVDELKNKKAYLHLHLYVQRIYADYKPYEELDDLYLASLNEDTLETYVHFFSEWIREFGALNAEAIDSFYEIAKDIKKEY